MKANSNNLGIAMRFIHSLGIHTKKLDLLLLFFFNNEQFLEIFPVHYKKLHSLMQDYTDYTRVFLPH